MLKLLQTFPGHQNPVYALANSDKAGIFFSAGADAGVVEWSLKKMAFVMVKWPVKSSVYTLHNYSNRLFAGERSGRFTVYDFIQQAKTADIQAHDGSIFDIKTLAGKQELLTTGEDGNVAVWSLTGFSEVYRFKISAGTVRAIAVSPDEKELAFACKDNAIRVYNADDFTFKYQLDGHTFPVTSIAWHPSGKYLISGGRDAQLRIWDTSTHTETKTIPAHMLAVYAIAFHPDLPYFATASQDKSIKIWDAETFKLCKILSREKSGTGHIHSVNQLTWSNDGQFLISTGDDRQVLVWEMEK